MIHFLRQAPEQAENQPFWKLFCTHTVQPRSMQLNQMTPASISHTHQLDEHLVERKKSLRLAATRFPLKPEANQRINATLTGTAKHLALGSRTFPHAHRQNSDSNRCIHPGEMKQKMRRAQSSTCGEAAVTERTPVSCSARTSQPGSAGAVHASAGSESLQLPLCHEQPVYHS